MSRLEGEARHFALAGVRTVGVAAEGPLVACADSDGTSGDQRLLDEDPDVFAVEVVGRSAGGHDVRTLGADADTGRRVEDGLGRGDRRLGGLDVEDRDLHVEVVLQRDFEALLQGQGLLGARPGIVFLDVLVDQALHRLEVQILDPADLDLLRGDVGRVPEGRGHGREQGGQQGRACRNHDSQPIGALCGKTASASRCVDSRSARSAAPESFCA